MFPLGAASPFFRALPIEACGLSWLHARYPLAHPLDGGGAVIVERSLAATARALGPDAAAYSSLLQPFVDSWEALTADVLAPMRWPAHPWLMARFGAAAVHPSTRLARRFRTEGARALVAGLAAHSGMPLAAPLTSAFAILLGALAHAVGWPVAAGGAASISAALLKRLRELGGEVVTGRPVRSLDELPEAALTFCDVAPEQLAQLAGRRLPAGFARRLRSLERGPGVFKVDWALDGPIPWQAAGCREAATVHVGGSFEEIAISEAAPRAGRVPEHPFVIVTQPSVCDPSRAPAGRQVAWGYCHLPTGAAIDATAAIERQIERFAPGFRDRVLARHMLSPAGLQHDNASLIGGDITGGAHTIRQFLARPTWRGYRTPAAGLYLCSASTPPGGGVHGMCGYWAARAAGLSGAAGGIAADPV